ncbi:hypothetical protein IQ254_21255 [Nodosilinea sp. LEGE 07088]|uniref:hypothetical protein n=1 Tax=Nodosilinea sp. LEGE 07088 TaxID=2777968 RepID=UPI001880ACB1|nr:hypothetical protein [Nodosilinea sp. LEGE 07088]MBE9139692.1 hypothetical protein [Nodosilinea sp. LEGE 07088]
MMTTPKWMPQTAIALIGFEGGLAIAYLAMIYTRGEALPLLDLNGLRSLPSWLQAAHLLAIGGLCLVLLRFRQRLAHPVSWFLPSALALLCLYGALDEVTKLHLWLHQVDWKLIYLGLLMAIPVLGLPDLVVIWRHHRGPVLWVLAGVSVFLLGGFGAEAAQGAIASELATHDSSRLLFLGEHLRITIEEFAELLGETLILYGMAIFTQQALPPRHRVPSLHRRTTGG